METLKVGVRRGQDKPNWRFATEIATKVLDPSCVPFAKCSPIIVDPMIRSVRPLLSLMEICVSRRFVEEHKVVFCIVNQFLWSCGLENFCRYGLKSKILGVNEVFEVLSNTLYHTLKGGNTEIKRAGFIPM